MRDPYEILGVSKTASEAEIKKAFRNLAKKHHPDTQSADKNAQKKFQEISGAYDIVGDKDKRTKFDAGEIDEAGNPRGFDPRAQGGGNPFGGGAGGPRDFNFSWSQGGEPGQGFSAEDLFSDLPKHRRSYVAAVIGAPRLINNHNDYHRRIVDRREADKGGHKLRRRISSGRGGASGTASPSRSSSSSRGAGSSRRG